jgi:cardiolipin synthase (CMP-forming)
MIFKIPNILTIGRLILVPVLVFAYYLPGRLGDWLGFSIFVIASFTDFLDGFFARLLKQQSKLGELLDPIADKIIVVTALVLLVADNQIKGQEVIASIIIICREILVSGLREYLAKFKLKIPVSNMAKVKTFFQMFAISILLTGSSGDQLLFNLGSEIGIALLWIAAVLTLVTGYSYLKKGIEHAID